jgi:hypothetical protein
VLEQKLVLGRVHARGGQALIFIGLAAVVAFLGSCGSTPSTTAAPTIAVSCVPTDVTVLSTAQCTATVLNLSSTLVNWSVSVSNSGTGNAGSITPAGLYTAPGTVPSNTVTVTATSQVQSTLTATQNVTIVAATAIATVTCVDSSNTTTLTVESGQDLSCTATTSAGAVVSGVTWSISGKAKGTALGSINPNQGVYRAPLVPPAGQTVTITASTANNLSTKSVTATVIFGNKVLSGSYVFSTSGTLATGAFWARAGSFTAGGGTLSGIEDTNQGGTPNTVTTVRTFTGSYSIGPDGRGTMQFCEDPRLACPQGSPATAYFRIVVVSPQQAQLIEFSSPSSASATTIAGGEMVSQDPLVLPPSSNLFGTYSFNFAGISSSGSEESVAGEFSANGFGTISAGSTSPPPAPGEMDIDAGGPAPLAGTIYSISSNGRGTVALNGLNFSFYPVSANRVKFIEVDPVPPLTATSSILIGDAYKQQTSSTCGWGLNALSGATVLETSGAASAVAVADVGSFTASNNGATGTISAGSLDQNSGGAISSQIATLSGNYAMDPDGCGRGTLSMGSHSYVFYIISPSNAVLQETTSGTVAHGFLVPSQSGSLADGSYALRMEGTNAAGAGGKAEDFLGQFTSVTPSGSGTSLSGTLDLNDFGATQTGLPIAAGTYTASAGDRSTATFPIGTPATTTRHVVLYTVSPTLFYVLGVDPSPAGTAVGVINNQF